MSASAAKPSVLFVCVHNAGRSQMAAAYLGQLAGGAVEVRSAGSAPRDQVNPVAVVCPVFPGTRYEDWVLDDPAGRPIEEVRRIRDEIRARVVALLAELGVPQDDQTG